MNASSEPKTQQDVCIDLPGETVRCWRSSDNIKVILRKHRDVVFNLRIKPGQIYTVTSTISDFYNARDKKIVFARRNSPVTFTDGERLHLWITRGFKGALAVSVNGKVLLQVRPNELDPVQYDENPTTKPAPLIVSVSPPQVTPGPVPLSGKINAFSSPLSAAHSVVESAPTDKDCPVVCVIEGTVEGMPQNIIDLVASGGGNSGLVDIDPHDVMTRNWILGQIFGARAYARDNWAWLRSSIDGRTHQGLKLVRARIHKVKGKIRFYFSGYSKYNTVFGKGGFGPGHDRVLSIFGGAGRTSSAFNAMGKGILGTFQSNALIAFIFSSATAIAEWKNNLATDNYDLAASLLMSVVKAVVATAIVVAIVAAVVWTIAILIKGALVVLAVGVFTVFIGLGVNYLVDALDKEAGRAITNDPENADGLAAVIAPYMRRAGVEIQASWTLLMKKLPKDYKELIF